MCARARLCWCVRVKLEQQSSPDGPLAAVSLSTKELRQIVAELDATKRQAEQLQRAKDNCGSGGSGGGGGGDDGSSNPAFKDVDASIAAANPAATAAMHAIQSQSRDWW